MIKKYIKFIILPAMFLMFITPIAYGVSYDRDNPGFEGDITIDSNQTTDPTIEGISINANDVPRIIQKIALWLYRLVLALSTVFGLYAAFLYLSGNPKNVEKAHQQLKYAFIGVAIAIISFSIEAIIKGIISR